MGELSIKTVDKNCRIINMTTQGDDKKGEEASQLTGDGVAVDGHGRSSA